jgi:hypothetical protein
MDQRSPLSRVARTSRLVLVTIALLTGCAHESAPTATTAPVTEPEPETTPAETDTTAGEATTEPAATVAVVEPPPDAEPVEEPPPPEPIDMTPAAAPALCESLVPEPETLQRSEFKRGGVTLPNDSRADVLECQYHDTVSGDVVVAYLVVRSAGADYATTEELGQSYDVPGMTSSYRLGRIERMATGVRIRVTGADTYYPDTGDPDSSGRGEVDSARVVVTCTFNAEYESYECERS